MGIYENIKLMSEKRNIPMYKIEQKAGIASGSICKWNNSSPNVKTLQKVAIVLGCKIGDLIDD